MSVRDFPPRPQGAEPESVPMLNWLDSLGQRQNIDLQQELTSVASGDEVMIFDVSETGNVKTKKATVSNVLAAKTPPKVFGFTRDMTTATGSVSYTGVGFQPKAIHLIGANTTLSTNTGFGGQCDSALNQNANYISAGATPAATQFIPGVLLRVGTDADYQTLVVTSMDSDGFTGTWTKTGAPGGTHNFSALCFS